MKPTNLLDAYELARVFEERYNSHRQVVRPLPSRNNTVASSGSSYNSRSYPAPANSIQPTNNSGRPMNAERHMSSSEYHERRAKKQCFFCDETYSPGHKCVRRGAAKVLVLDGCVQQDSEDLCSLLDLPALTMEEQGADNLSLALDTPLITLNVLTDKHKPNTMQIQGSVGVNQKIHILIDSGSTHNFVHPSLITKDTGFVDFSRPLRVLVASGARVLTKGFLPKFQLSIQGYQLEGEFYILPVPGCEVVLGAAWLQTLGDILWNFDRMTMKFFSQGHVVSLQGILHSTIESVSFKSMSKWTTKEGEALLIEMQQILNRDSAVQTPTQLQSILTEFAWLFKEPTELPPHRTHDHRIPLLPGATPVNVRPYRYPYFQKSEIEKIIKEMLASGVIQPSVSPFSSPVLIVKKKDGSSRMCVDYRALNSVTVKDKFPISVVDELLDELHGAVIFSKLDLRSGYHQIRMEPSDINKTAFRTHQGHYEFLVMPFGLTNAPSTFQSLMNEIFKDQLRDFVLVFFDDILVYSTSMEKHIQHLRMVLSKLQAHQLKVKLSKCSFGAASVEYLGHIISAQGVSVDPNKVKAIQQWPKPKTLKGLRGFLGLAGYYRKFVKNFGSIAKPLTSMLKKDGFHWTPAADEAFDKLKMALITTPVLALPDFSKDFTIECDASDVGVGAVLSQGGHPIAFLSKVLSQKHLALSVYDKEMMAVVIAVEHWRPYLLGHHFNIITDHRTIEHFLKQRITTPSQQKWLIKLLGYNYTVQYRSGINNAAPDALSRKAELRSLVGSSTPSFPFLNEMQQDLLNDPASRETIAALKNGTCTKKGFTLSGEFLYYKCRLYVPDCNSWRLKLMLEFHNGPMGGHSGFLRTYKRLT